MDTKHRVKKISQNLRLVILLLLFIDCLICYTKNKCIIYNFRERDLFVYKKRISILFSRKGFKGSFLLFLLFYFAISNFGTIILLFDGNK